MEKLRHLISDFFQYEQSLCDMPFLVLLVEYLAAIRFRMLRMDTWKVRPKIHLFGTR